MPLRSLNRRRPKALPAARERYAVPNELTVPICSPPVGPLADQLLTLSACRSFGVKRKSTGTRSRPGMSIAAHAAPLRARFGVGDRSGPGKGRHSRTARCNRGCDNLWKLQRGSSQFCSRMAPTRRSVALSFSKFASLDSRKTGAPGKIRTRDPQVHSLEFYVEYQWLNETGM